MEALGTFEVPTDWDGVIERHQATADLLAAKQGHDQLDVASLYDRRFEKALVDVREEGTP